MQKLLSFDPSFPLFLSLFLSLVLSLLLLILDRTDVCSPLLRLFPTQVRAKMDFSRKKRKEKLLLCSHRHTTVIAGPTCLIAHLLAPHDYSLPHGIAQGVALVLDCGWIKGLGRLFLQLLPLVLPINT